MPTKSTHGHGGARPGSGRKRIKRTFRQGTEILFHSILPDGTWTGGRVAIVEIDPETGIFAFVFKDDGERMVADW